MYRRVMRRGEVRNPHGTNCILQFTSYLTLVYIQPELSFAARELTNLPVGGSSSHAESLNSKNRHHVTVPSVLIICIKSVFHLWNTAH